jgi:hypothetical protein
MLLKYLKLSMKNPNKTKALQKDKETNKIHVFNEVYRVKNIIYMALYRDCRQFGGTLN